MCKECNWLRSDHKKWIPLLYSPEIGMSYRIFFKDLNREGFADFTTSGWKNIKNNNGSPLTTSPELITHWLPL